jgi:DNA-binding transcriptional MerR regulator
MARPPSLLKISELAERSGVAAGTIRFYIREGLLPRPTMKTSRNMAYYDAAFVERIKLIRRLQEERRLPLSAIHTLLSNAVEEGRGDLPSLLELEAEVVDALDAPDAAESTRAELLERTGIDPCELDTMIELGLLTPRDQEAAQRFSPDDAGIVEVVARARASGLSREIFPTGDIAVYRDAAAALVGKEAQLLARRVRRREPTVPVAAMVKSAVHVGGELFTRLRRKLIADLSGALEHGDASPPTRPAKRRPR